MSAVESETTAGREAVAEAAVAPEAGIPADPEGNAAIEADPDPCDAAIEADPDPRDAAIEADPDPRDAAIEADPDPRDAAPIAEDELRREIDALRRARPQLRLALPLSVGLAAAAHLAVAIAALLAPSRPGPVELARRERPLALDRLIAAKVVMPASTSRESLLVPPPDRPDWLKRSPGSAAALARRAGDAGVLGLLRSSSGSHIGGTFSRDMALGIDASELIGDRVGASHGVAGLGLIGSGRGGGGLSARAVGVGYGRGAGRLSGRAAAARYGRGVGTGPAVSAGRPSAAWRAGAAPRGPDAPRREPLRPRDEATPAEQAGLLTAAAVGDADRFDHYLSFLQRHPAESKSLGLAMERRVRVRVVDAEGRPVNGAALTIASPGGTVQGRTHADGRWDLYPGVSAPQAAGAALLTVRAAGQTAQRWITLPSSGEGEEQTMQLPITTQSPRALELAFLVDATGSMDDELHYLRSEILSIVERLRTAVPGLQLRLGAVFYRDRCDEEQLRLVPFTASPKDFRASINPINAAGGGDYPEDVNAGLQAAMRRLQWSSTPDAVRVLVHIADAPPQPYADETYRYPQAMRDASARGIRLLPVAASGADRTVEVLFRAMAAFTSTPYVYLTDDSGVGGTHLEADTERVAIERFNDLLVRLLVSDLRGKGMHEPGKLGPAGNQGVARRGRGQGPS